MNRDFIKIFALSVAAVFSACMATAQVRLPEGYFLKTLPNGLDVLVIENSKVPLTTIEIAVKNGAYTEGPEYSGLSHLFEHMFFKANKDYPTQEKFLKRTQELGAIWNGTTNTERVNYFFTFDRDSLKAGLKFMNAAIRFPIYREEDMKKERPVVDGEFQRAESDPGFQLWYGMQQKLWGDLITRKNPIGVHEVINTATPEKMMIIKDKYYFPNNSLLTICGDVKHDNAFALAENIFGDWANSGFDPQTKFPIPAFKPLTKPEYFVKEATIAQTPYMEFTWQGPSYPTDSAGTVVADVFSTIVGLNSSKLQQALVDKGLASGVYVNYTTSRYVGPIDIFVVPNPNKLKECYTELMNQISMWNKDDYFTDEQMATAKAILHRNDIHAKEKPSSLPSQISYQWCSTSFNFYTDLDANYQKVTRADIKKYLETYVIGKPYAAGLIIAPELNKTVNAASFLQLSNLKLPHHDEKYIIALLVAAAIGNTARAQKQAYETTVDGVKVIVQPSGNDIVEVQTIIKGGVQNYPATKAGIESLAMSALTECGTLKHDKNSFKDELDKVSATVYGSSNKNYSVVRMNCIKGDFDVVWPLYVEAITQPKFDEKEFTRIKQDAINNIKQEDSQPDNAIDKYADKVAFAGTNYAKDPSGTVPIITALTPAETKAYYQSILTKSRLVIVVVADLDQATIEAKVKAMLSGIKQGSAFAFKKSTFRAEKNTINVEKRDLATNYVEGIASGPAAGTPDFNAFNVAMRIFSNMHFLEVRTNNGLSYAPQAWFSAGQTSTAKFSVSTTEPDKYIAVFDKLVDKIKREGFKPEDVADMKVTYLTGFYYKNETNSAQASSIAANEVLHDNWKRSLTLVDDVKKLTPDDVSNAFRKYINNIVWVYQGDPKKVNQLLYINGTLHNGENPVNH